MKLALMDAWRALRARPSVTLVAQAGITLALAASLLVGLLALALAQTDASIPEPDRVVTLDFMGNPTFQRSEWFGAAPVFFGPALKARGAPLQHIARVQGGGFTLRMTGGDYKMVGLLLPDPEIVPLMGLRALHGDLEATLRQPDAVALTRRAVTMVWGDLPPQQAIGRMLTDHGKNYRVGAVVPDFNSRHPLQGNEMLAGIEGHANTRSAEDRNAIFMVNGRVFARLAPGVQAEQVGGWMRAAFYDHPGFGDLPKEWSANGREPAFFRALTLPASRFEGESERWTQIGALGAACALLLVMATVNALNLQSAQLLQRQRETALRQSLGASHAALWRLWACEQGLALLMSGASAWLIAWWLAPGLVAWLGLPAHTDLFHPLPWAVLGGLGAVVALLLPLTLALPAWVALRQAPARALQGRTASEGPWGRRLRQGLLSLQLVGALLLLALTGVLTAQHRHLLHADRGFSLDNRLLLDVFAREGDQATFAPLVQAVTQLPAVQSWAFSDVVPPWAGLGTVTVHRRPDQATGPTLSLHHVTPSFFATYGMRVLAGDPYAKTQGEARLVVDAESAKLLGFATPQAAVGQLVLGGAAFNLPGDAPRRIVAVVAQAQLQTAREAARPRGFVLSEAYSQWLTLHAKDLPRLQTAVKQLWQQFNLPFDYRLDPVQTQMTEAYRQDGQLAGLLGALSVLAVAVAVVGAYALVADTLRRRRTELVLHRLHGAGGADIVRQVALEFRTPVLLALGLGVPVAAWLGQLYLSGFVDHVALGEGLVLPLLLATGLTVVVLCVAAWRHTRLALNLRPIEALA
ncbi:FtsX-like permease family protein [Inhella gelatinilytica]|uniref:ABC3 transporter permease C-terminal domain-containing protein n=1 Tax=Inhella gelatinilytica TaxID=2795030 RepID=A0A931IZZ6_9BURK|nr:FtsX-like permease family protein [Inhella gelatinilytica]MBH9554130.1 hypothetical protein [Inhella gelatinilytica]